MTPNNSIEIKLIWSLELLCFICVSLIHLKSVTRYKNNNFKKYVTEMELE